MISAFAFLALAAQGTDQPLLVQSEWLAERLHEPTTVVFHVGPRESYDQGHIPGAQFIQLSEISAPRESTPLPLELPSVASLDSVLESKGIGDSSRIVVYWADEWVSPTTRVVFTLTWVGLGGRVSVLDGGLPAWVEAGHEVSTEVPIVMPGEFTPRVHAEVVVDGAWVHERLEDAGTAVVDARDRRFYDGDSADGRIPRPGHIAGARSLPFGEVLGETLRFKSPSDLATLLADAGVEDGTTVVTYCHIGQQASVVWFAAKLAGREAKLYDGSYTDWAAKPDLPVEKQP